MTQETLFGEQPIVEPEIQGGATISDDGVYRYTLARHWAPTGPRALFMMLNPSTADATEDDPTIRRCVGFAKSWGLVGIRVVNLYALRATNPKDLWTHPDPIGPDNDSWITAMADATEGPIVAAWGANAEPDRVAHVLGLPRMETAQHLGLTKAGQPRHPLYLRADTRLEYLR